MARFYGTVHGARGPASRLGHRDLHVTAQSFAGDIVVDMWRDDEDNEQVSISCRQHSGNGGYCLYNGKVKDLLNQDVRFARIKALGLDAFMKEHDIK